MFEDRLFATTGLKFAGKDEIRCAGWLICIIGKDCKVFPLETL